jgi:hypothetical protein
MCAGGQPARFVCGDEPVAGDAARFLQENIVSRAKTISEAEYTQHEVVYLRTLLTAFRADDERQKAEIKRLRETLGQIDGSTPKGFGPVALSANEWILWAVDTAGKALAEPRP